MSTLPKFTIYRCDVCDRDTEIQLDGNRPAPIRCNITLKCRGKLQKTGERSSKKFLFTPLVAGLQDYVPRGTAVTAPLAEATSTPFPIFTGEMMIAASVLRRKVVGSNSVFYTITPVGDEIQLETQSSIYLLPLNTTITLQLFEITPELLQFKKYTYLFNSTAQLIIGADDSPEGRNLRFNSSNKLKVYANGVELQASQFDKSIADQITLTPAVTGTNNVIEVLVYDDIDILLSTATFIPITMRSLTPTVAADLALRNLNCWGNFRSAEIGGTDRIIMFATDFSLLDSDKSYGVARIEASSATLTSPVEVRPSEFKLLIGREPFAIQDKERFAYLDGTTLIDGDAVLSYNRSTGTGALELTVDVSELTQIYNTIIGRNRVTQADNTLNAAETALGITPLRKKYILGPS